MNVKYYIFFLGIVLIGCSTSSKVKNNVKYTECAQNYKNDFAEVTEEKYTTIFESDTLEYTQIKFQCTSSALYNLRTMYGFFGKWHESIIPQNRKKPLLIWKTIDLFSDGKKYNVVTLGGELSRNDISTSFMIFDDKGEDVLLNDEVKTKAIQFFAENIHNSKNESKEYYYEYLKEFAPKYWKKYKTWNGIN